MTDSIQKLVLIYLADSRDLRLVSPSMPAEPLGFLGNLTLNSGGFFLSRPRVCRHWLRMISPTSKWHERVENLFAEYPDIPRTDMGLPESRTSHPIWIS